MKLPKTERGRVTLAWKLLDRVVAHCEQSAGITPEEPLTSHPCPRRDMQIARMLINAHAASRGERP